MKNIFKYCLILLMSFQFSQASEYIIDSAHSNIGFSIKHLMISNVKGTFKSFDAELEFDEKTKTFTNMFATIETTSIDTGIKKRDDHLRSSDFFDVQKYPTIVFEMTSINDDIITGDITIHGVKKEIKLTSTIHGVIKDSQGNLRVGFTLEGALNRKDFGLSWNKLLEGGGLTVGEKVTITIDVEAIEL